jgi:AraC-like DNA-binding protein
VIVLTAVTDEVTVVAAQAHALQSFSGEGRMPSSAVRTFSDPNEYAAAIRAGTVEATVTERGNFHAKLTRIDLHRLWMQRFSDNLPRILDAVNISRRAIISFRTQPGLSLLGDGLEIGFSTILRHSAGHNYYQRSSGSACFGTMSLPVEDIAAVGEAMTGADLTPPKDALTVTPSSSAMARLQRLHAAAGWLAEEAPEIIAHPEAARGLEQALIEAWLGCLAEGTAGEDRSAQRKHSLIMRRFRRAVEEDPDMALYISELCAAIATSDRTLRVCCQEQLGMSPRRYLLLRRMSLARRALRDAAPGRTSVTVVAADYGFWQFGRFAGEYKSLFGETPSTTLRRPRA